MSVRFLFVFNLFVNLFRIALWLSVRKDLAPWSFAGVVYLAVLTVHVPFPFEVQSGTVNSIESTESWFFAFFPIIKSCSSPWANQLQISYLLPIITCALSYTLKGSAWFVYINTIEWITAELFIVSLNRFFKYRMAYKKL